MHRHKRKIIIAVVAAMLVAPVQTCHFDKMLVDEMGLPCKSGKPILQKGSVAQCLNFSTNGICFVAQKTEDVTAVSYFKGEGSSCGWTTNVVAKFFTLNGWAGTNLLVKAYVYDTGEYSMAKQMFLGRCLGMSSLPTRLVLKQYDVKTGEVGDFCAIGRNKRTIGFVCGGVAVCIENSVKALLMAQIIDERLTMIGLRHE